MVDVGVAPCKHPSRYFIIEAASMATRLHIRRKVRDLMWVAGADWGERYDVSGIAVWRLEARERVGSSDGAV